MNINFIKILSIPIDLLYLIKLLFNRKYIKSIHVMTADQTVKLIISQHLSVSRFGDGEMLIIKGKDIGFQSYSCELSKRLVEVFKNQGNNHIVCIPRPLVDLSPYTLETRVFWKWSFVKHIKTWIQFLRRNGVYGDTQFTRFYIDMKDKNTTGDRLKILKRLWNDRDLLIVEGKETRLGVGNDLFKNAHSIRRIICPSQNAFSYYDQIKNAIQNYKKELLILIALGPTATVLAYELSQIGYQAIDIGHIDIEYEWYLRGTDKKIPIQGKYVNECHTKGEVIVDEIYKSQIDLIISEL